MFGRELLLKDCHANNAPVMPNYMNRMPRLPINRNFFSNRYASRKKIGTLSTSIPSLPHTVILPVADDCVDRRNLLQHGQDGSGTDGDGH